MALLRNVSGVAKVVGGWQQDEKGPNGGAHLPVTLQPGQTVTVSEESLNHPVVRGLAASADFELDDVTLVPGGPVDTDPGARLGKLRVMSTTVTHADFSAALPVETITLSLVVPAGSLVEGVVLETSTGFTGGGAASCVLNIGDATDANRFSSGGNPSIFTAIQTTTGSDAPICRSDTTLKAALTVTGEGATAAGLTAGSTKVTVFFTVLPVED